MSLSKGLVTGTRQFFLQLTTQRRCETRCGRNCTCDTYWQLILPGILRCELPTRLLLFATLRDKFQRVQCRYSAPCLAMFLSSLRCKVQEKFHHVTALRGENGCMWLPDYEGTKWNKERRQRTSQYARKHAVALHLSWTIIFNLCLKNTLASLGNMGPVFKKLERILIVSSSLW